MKKRLTTLLTLATVALGACSSASTASSSNAAKSTTSTIKLGAQFELTGAGASYGNAILDAIKLRVDQQNSAGGVLGKQVELVQLDNKTDAKESASAATNLVQQGVVGLLGPATTGASLAQSPVATKAKVPAILPAATGDTVLTDSSGKTLEYIFRTAYSDSSQGEVLATFAQKKGYNKVVVLQDASSDYGKGLAKVFSANYTGTVVATESFQSGDKDFNAILTKLKGLDFDAIIVFGYYEEGGPIIGQARRAGLTQPIVGPDGFASSTLVELAGGSQYVTDVYFSNHFTALSTDENVVKFLKEYKDKYGKDADAFSALGYDAAGLMLQAIEQAGEATPEKIKDALAATKEYKGVTGTFSVGSDHNVKKSTYMIEMQNGKEVGYEVVAPK